MKLRIFVTFLIGLLVVACNPTPEIEVASPASEVPDEKSVENVVAEPARPTEASTDEPNLLEEAIPVDVQVVEFTSTDGTVLQGAYYPPEIGPAPVVVLMHQYPLDHETEWFAIAPWLQNRGLAESVLPGDLPWGNPLWFPAVPDDLDVGVFVFTFRGCQEGCQNAGLSRAEGAIWAEDARAALLYAANLPGADSERIVAVGTSIGADGAVDGCWLAEEDGLQCAGAMSWSPGSYLMMPYDETVGYLTESGVLVRCFAGEGDIQSAETCRSYSGDGYEIEIDPSGNHGIALVDPDLEIATLNLLLDFLNQTVGQ